MARMLAFVLLVVASGLDDIQLDLSQQGELLNVFSELQQVGKETSSTFAKVYASPPTEPPPLVAPLNMLESAASVAEQPEIYQVQQQPRRPKTMSEAFQAFDSLTNTKSAGLASLSAGAQYGRQKPQLSMMTPVTPAIHRGPLESILLDDDTAEEQPQPMVQPQGPQQPEVNIDFQRLLGGKPMGVDPRPLSSVSRQQEFLPPVMLQHKVGDDDSNDVPATGLWQAPPSKWPKFKGDVFDAYRRGLRNRHARGVQEAFVEVPSDKTKDVFGKYKDGISKNEAADGNNEMSGFASRLQTEIGLLSHTPQVKMDSLAMPPQLGGRPITETAQEHLLKFHQSLERLEDTPPGWETPQSTSMLQEPGSPSKNSVFQVYRSKLRSSQPAILDFSQMET
jgi:hypothetical protein